MGIALSFNQPPATTSSGIYAPDRRIDTMELLYPKRKPVGKVKIDWSHPLAKGLVSANVFSDQNLLSNMVSGLKGSFNTTDADLVSSLGRRGIDFSTSSGGFSTGVGVKGSSFSGLSVVTSVKTPSVFSTQIIAENGTGYNTNTFFMDVESSGIAAFETYGLGYNTAKSNILSPNSWYSICGRWSSGLDNEIFINGASDVASLAGSAQSSLIDGDTLLMIGSRDAAAFKYNGIIEYNYVYGRALSDQEIKSLHDDPYQILIPE